MRTALVIASLCAAPLVNPVAAQDFFTLKGHGGPIMDIAVSSSGQIATASFDNSVGLWEGTDPRWFEGSEAAVTTVRFAGEEALVAAGDDFTVRAWITETGEMTVVGQHQAKVTALAFPGNGPYLASASWDATIRLWQPVEVIQKRPLRQSSRSVVLEGHTQGVNDIAFTSDGTTLFSASADGTIRVWDILEGAEKTVLTSHGFGVNTLILNEAEGWLAYGAVDGGTRVIDPETGQQIADFTLDRRPILAMAYSPATKMLAVGDGEGYIMIIDTEQMRIAKDFRATKKGPIWALAFSPDGQNIHAGGIEDIMYSWPIDTLTEHDRMSGTTRSFLEDPETLPNGERQFKRKCSICHTLTAGSARKAGPSLHNVFGRRAGTVADYSYSDTLEGSEIVWSAETINDLFDEGPDHYIPGTKMPMQVISAPQDRKDLIAFLQTATASEGE